MQRTAYRHSPHAARFAHPVRNVGALGIEQGMRVADFGAGSGAYVLAIAERLGNTGNVYAVDVQRDLLRRILGEARGRGFTNVHVIWSDLENAHASKLADHSLDLVLISNLLFQLTDKLVVLREAWRVLRPAGKLAIVDWSDSFGPSTPLRASGIGPVKGQVVKKEEAQQLARKAGFELVREFHAGAHHYGLILRPVPQKDHA